MSEATRYWLRVIASEANELVDRGANPPLADVELAIEDGRIVEWLDGIGADLSVLRGDGMRETHGALLERLQGLNATVKGKERRTYGIENNGLCYLIALAIDAMSE